MGAACIVCLGHWCDRYCVKARGTIPSAKWMGDSPSKGKGKWKSGPIMMGTLADQCRTAIHLWSDLSGKIWLVPIINPHLSFPLCLSPFLPSYLFFFSWIRFFRLFLLERKFSGAVFFMWTTLDMTLRRMTERHLSERDIKSNKDLSSLRAQRVSCRKTYNIWTKEQ